MKRFTSSVALLLMLVIGAYAVPIGLQFNTFDATTFDPIIALGPDNVNAVPVGNMIQVIKAGANGVADAPGADGSVAGDDTLAFTFPVGFGSEMDGTFSTLVSGFSVANERVNSSSIYVGIVFYFRVWFHSTIAGAVPVPAGSYYGTYGPYTCPSSDSEFWNVTMNPGWTSTGPAPAPAVEVTYDTNVQASGSLQLFGNVQIPASSGMTYTLTNTGNAMLNYGVGNVTGDFATTLVAGSLAAGANTTFNISFTPTDVGTRNGTFSFTHDAAGTPFTFVLEGTGVAAPVYGEGNPGANVTNPNPPANPWTPAIPTDPNTGGFAPLGIFFGGGATNPGSVDVNYEETIPSEFDPEYAASIFPAATTVQRWWNISETGGAGFTCDVEFFFTSDDLPLGYDPMTSTNIIVARFDAVTGEYLGLYWPTISIVSAGPPTVYRAFIAGVTGFSIWSIGDYPLLPVTGLAMSANGGNGQVTLAWSVESEINNAYFQVERRVAGGEWSIVSRVNSRAPGGNSSSRVRYSFEDMNVVNGTTYEYRVIDVNIDGIPLSNSLVVSATPSAPVIAEYALSHYPQPFNPETRINYTVKDAGVVTLTVTNIMGQSVATLVSEHKLAGNHSVTWNAGNLPSGIYFLRYDVNGFHGMSKMVLSK
ncbi:MAG: T9SS type A sorting domain-containing protein [bacterium]|nr:T9SS type A sorting domain-containing protein [bacterium]